VSRLENREERVSPNHAEGKYDKGKGEEKRENVKQKEREKINAK
jgi:hypothetical protein